MEKRITDYLISIRNLPEREFERKARLYAEFCLPGYNDMEICRLLSRCRQAI